jgi:hypothetical protein
MNLQHTALIGLIIIILFGALLAWNGVGKKATASSYPIPKTSSSLENRVFNLEQRVIRLERRAPAEEWWKTPEREWWKQ